MELLTRFSERPGHFAAMVALDLRLAARSILRQTRRSALGLGAVAAGVMALLLASGFFEWNYHSLRESIINARIGHIQIVKLGYFTAGTADPFAFLIPEASNERAQVEQLPQVKAVAPRIVFSGLISVGDSTVSFMGEGVNPESESQLSGALVIQSGEDLTSETQLGVILGQGLASSLGVVVGQPVILLAKTRSGGVNAVEVPVKGIFFTATKAYDDYALRVPLKVAQGLLHTSGVHTWLILLHQTRQTNDVIKTIRHRMMSSELEVVPWYDTSVADFYKKTVSLFAKQVLILKIMIAVIVVLSISNTMMTSVRERVSEIGTCMALGDRRATILRRFMAEGAITGLFGGVFGAVLGVGLARLITWIGIPMPPAPGTTTGYVAGILITPMLLLDAISLSVVTALLAGVYPAWRASRLRIVDALRHAQ